LLCVGATIILRRVNFNALDERFMRRALALARRGLGQTSPNPAVGAVVVRAGKIIGEGWHQRAGSPHAEINALRRVANARGATLYVTLEPCCTHGRTPPCADAILAAGIRRVVVAATDPNPKHRGRGLRLLRKAGVSVESGLLAAEATALNAAFNKWITTGMPLVVAKSALSLDGKMATRTGDSKWITSDAARREAHQLRAGVDAVMVGANTVIADNPRLTLRHGARGRQPWRVVVDARGRSPRVAKLFTDVHRRRTIVLTTAQSSPRWRRYLEVLGVTVLLVPVKGAGRNARAMWKADAMSVAGATATECRTPLDLRAALRELGRMEITSVMIEGGAMLLASAFDAGVVDRVAFFVAPKIFGGIATVASASVARGAWRKVGRDEILFEGELR
jgi:diaminohydroxyphosphoribosylaminopyrimidine deaminase/5-amino-6-(5-phosphoribosylamino)uracil reductase